MPNTYFYPIDDKSRCKYIYFPKKGVCAKTTSKQLSEMYKQVMRLLLPVSNKMTPEETRRVFHALHKSMLLKCQGQLTQTTHC
jgi:hypothetical protein